MYILDINMVIDIYVGRDIDIDVDIYIKIADIDIDTNIGIKRKA